MVTITVAAIEWPKEGKKQGAIIDSTGKRWGVWGDKMAGYQQFASYDITYETREFRGQSYTTIKTAAPLSGGPTAPPSPPLQTYHPSPAAGGFDNGRRMDIYVCGAVNNMLANPNVQPMQLSAIQLAELTRKAIDAWKLSFGPKPIARGELDSELDDEIPFS
jgi:hypothetical protein